MLLVLPILIPLTAAALTLICWNNRILQHLLSLLSMEALLICSIFLLIQVYQDGIQVSQIGNWRAPFGITFVADQLSTIMVLLTSITSTIISIFSIISLDQKREKYGYHPVFLVMIAGINGVFLTGDIFNLYVWFEMILMGSFILLALGGLRDQLEAAIKYVTLNLFASTMFLTAIALLYGNIGTLNMADLALKVKAVGPTPFLMSVSLLFFVAFGIKAAIFPLFSWLPASYHTPPIAVTAMFAAILTKVGVYSMLRVFTLIFSQSIAYYNVFILIIAAITMLTGVFGALAQNDIRRILAFHGISQVGYMVMGIGLGSALGFAGTIYFFIHHSLVKSNLFLISGLIEKIKGSFDLKKLGGMQNVYPGLSILFLISAMSLAGMPPLSGFFAKLGLVKEGFNLTFYGISAVALIVGLLTLISMTKIWTQVFWKKPPEEEHHDTKIVGVNFLGLYLPICFMTLLIVSIGFAIGPIYDYVVLAAKNLQDPTEYIQKVLGGIY